jgi:hypothetical protein
MFLVYKSLKAKNSISLTLLKLNSSKQTYPCKTGKMEEQQEAGQTGGPHLQQDGDRHV